METITEYRQVIINHEKLNKGIKCPFCNKNNMIERCEHYYSSHEPKIRSVITDTPIGNYVFVFKK